MGRFCDNLWSLMKPISLLTCALLVSLSGACLGLADTVTNIAVADTSLFETDPDNNLGRSTLASGTTAQGMKSRALLKFDLSNIPAGAVITNVRVQVTVTKSPAGAAASTFALRRMLKDWNEGTSGSGASHGQAAKPLEATWNTRSFGQAGAEWTAAGAASGIDYAESDSGTVAVAGGGNYFFNTTAALEADVTSWRDNPAANFGWIMQSQAEGTLKTARRFGSREGNAVVAPKLIISYSAAAVTAPVITTPLPDQFLLAGATLSFTVTATGSEPLTYSWSRNGTPIPNAQGSTLQIAGAQRADAGLYSVQVSNAAGQASASANVSVLDEIRFSSITLEPPSAALRFTVPLGYRVEVQSAETLANPVWSSLTNLVATSADLAALVTDLASAPQKIYRLQAFPAR